MLRNKEIQKFLIWFFVISAMVVVIGFFINVGAGILLIMFSFAVLFLFLRFTKARYQRIAHISEQIDQVLHNADYLYIDDSEEGELSILQSEITKMTIRIREQNDALKKEKAYLVESLADIAHQLRTPLTSAHLVLSLLEKNPNETDRRDLLRELEELLVGMEWLVNSLLKLSRLDAGIVPLNNEPIAIKTLITAAVHPLLLSMELHGVKLCTEMPAEMVIQGDIGWLSQAIQNILKNCIQSIGDSGSIQITCTDTLLYGEISIHDSGKGFAKEDLPHIFKRFYRSKGDDSTGYGIGLALSKMIITRHGGTIVAKNHPAGGAVFCIRFPK